MNEITKKKNQNINLLKNNFKFKYLQNVKLLFFLKLH